MFLRADIDHSDSLYGSPGLPILSYIVQNYNSTCWNVICLLSNSWMRELNTMPVH